MAAATAATLDEVRLSAGLTPTHPDRRDGSDDGGDAGRGEAVRVPHADSPDRRDGRSDGGDAGRGEAVRVPHADSP
jgi:hypothetical protein